MVEHAPPLTEQVAQLDARASALDDVRDRIEDVSQSRELRSVEWGEVKRELDARRGAVVSALGRARELLGSATAEQRAVGYWRQAPMESGRQMRPSVQTA